MRLLKRDMKKFWYCPWLRKEAVKDSAGNSTGETRAVYGSAVECYGIISEPRGSVTNNDYGRSIDYDKTITTESSCSFNEMAVLFVDKEPEYDSSGNPKYDYIVYRASHSQWDGNTYRIRRVR